MRVRVPASSANLGPGFDCFGIAWRLYNEIEFNLADRLEISGCDDRFQNADNLAYKAYSMTLERCGIKNCGVNIRFAKTDIPVSRGLGSSSALIVGGVLAADALYDLRLDNDALLEIATEAEGHPDNVAPALLGGLTASTMVNGAPVTVHFSLSDKLHFAAIVPPFELSTSLARSVLPKSLSREDAIFNVSRAALALNALGGGDCAMLSMGMEDRMHQPFRLPLIDGWEKAKTLAESCGGKAMCISGAGSTLLCASDEEGFSGRVCEAVEREMTGWRVIPLLADFEGAKAFI
jgi:homoserine kinase